MIFISHSKMDREYANRIASRLTECGHECWLDEDRFPLGERFVFQIADALRRSKMFLVLDSPAAESSYWVKREISMATRLRRLSQLRKTFCLQTTTTPTFLSEWADWAGSTEQGLLDQLRIRSFRAPWLASRDRHLVQVEGSHSDPVDLWLGFSEDLRKLDEWWFSDSMGFWVQGPAASGKSELVRVWMTAVREMGYEVPLKLSIFYTLVWAHRDTKLVREWLRSTCVQTDTLLILDELDTLNIHEQADVLELAAIMRHRVIVIARNGPPGSLADEFNLHTLEPMNEEAAALMLQREIGDADVSREAAKLLRGSPVAVAQAIAALREGRLGLDELLGVLRRHEGIG